MPDHWQSSSLVDFGPMAGGYEHWYQTQPGRRHDQFQKALVREVLPAALPGATLLDVGCGTGHWSRFFASLGYDVVGIDICAEMIAQAKSTKADGEEPRCRYVLASAESIPFDDGSFDVIAAVTTLEFVTDPQAVLDEMVRCLRPGGTIVIGTLDRTASFNRNRLARGKQPYASAHLFSMQELGELLERYGRVEMRTSTEEDASGADGALIVATLAPC